MSRPDGLVRRVKTCDTSANGINYNATNCNENSLDNTSEIDGEENLDIDDFEDTCFSLMEEVLLLGLKNDSTSFWNNSISSGLRGCILIELGLRGQVAIEKAHLHSVGLLSRKLILKSDMKTGDDLLDETLSLIKETNPPETVLNWIDSLSGELWTPNPFNVQYARRLINVRERLAQNLVDKGILTTKIQNYLLFNVTTYPLTNDVIKDQLIKKIQDSILVKWVNDPQLMDKRMLALVMLSHASDVLNHALDPLNDDDYQMAMKRVRTLLDLDYEAEAAKPNADEILWAVFMALEN